MKKKLLARTLPESDIEEGSAGSRSDAVPLREVGTRLRSISDGEAAAFLDGQPIVGLCLEDAGSDAAGKILVRWDSNRGRSEQWVPTLRGVVCRRGDHALLQQPLNWETPIIVGVIASEEPCATSPSPDKNTFVLAAGDRLTIRGKDGTELLVIDAADDGTTVKINSGKQTWEFTDSLKIVAASLDLQATSGEVVMSSPKDVIVRGRTIRLN